jgi:hypothetical protein
MGTTINNLSRSLQESIENLSPDEMASYLHEMILGLRREVSSGKINEHEEEVEMNAIIQQALIRINEFSAIEYIRFRESYHRLFEHTIFKNWTLENISNYETICRVIDDLQETWSLYFNYVVDGLSDEDSTRVTTQWESMKKGWQSIRQYYQEKLDKNVKIRDRTAKFIESR